LWFVDFGSESDFSGAASFASSAKGAGFDVASRPIPASVLAFLVVGFEILILKAPARPAIPMQNSQHIFRNHFLSQETRFGDTFAPMQQQG
jgi:hypothetical protein